MDTSLYFRVVWRFRVVVAVGFLAAVALASLATFRISFGHAGPKLTYRQSVVYQADTLLLLTQKGFPWGRTVLPSGDNGGLRLTQPQGNTPFADPSRFSQLAVFYSQLANGDAVQFAMKRDRSLHGKMLAATLPDPANSGQSLPIVDIQGLAKTRGDAVRLSATGATVLRRYVQRQQDSAGISDRDRVLVSVLKRPDKLLVVVPRKKTIPILVFLTLMTATIGAAFLLENLRPRLRSVESQQELQPGSRRKIA